MGSATRLGRNECQKELIRCFESLCGKHSRWEIWSDFIQMSAISISNVTDRAHAAEREETYMTLSRKYTSKELEVFAQMLAYVINGMDQTPDQDFLGELYMALNMGNDHAGQFFTPYDVCRLMSELQPSAELETTISKQGWVTVNDCACGAGATLVAFANDCLRRGINYQTSVLFVAQDIDYIVGLMCYLQLSLMGCAGYVAIGDTLSHPCTSYDRRGLIPVDDGHIWYTPMYFSDRWQWRCIATRMDMLCQRPADHQPSPKQDVQDGPSPVLIADSSSRPVQAGSTPTASSPEPFHETKAGQLTFF